MQVEKKTIVEDLQSKVDGSSFLVVTDYAGMTVPQFEELRSKLRENGAHFHVTKNSYLKKVVEEADLPEEMASELTGQTAIVFGEDVCGACKAIKEFSKATEKPGVKVGTMDGKLLSKDEIMTLASLPSREALLSQLLGLIQAPGSGLARLVNEPGSQVARLMKAYSEKDN